MRNVRQISTLAVGVACALTSATVVWAQDVNPNAHQVGDAIHGKQVFRFETFGNERYWTDALQLPQGIVAAKLTPVQALTLGLSVDVNALSKATQAVVLEELATDLSPANAPVLNSPATTIALLNANAVIGVVVVDTNLDGMRSAGTGDKVGVTCALCHTVTDGAVVSLSGGGSIGNPLDGLTNHNLHVGDIFAAAANTRALYPLAQLAFDTLGGATIGKAPTGLSQNSSEADIDAYFSNHEFYPVGQFDAFPDGIGNPTQAMPLFRTDLSSPWGFDGGSQLLEHLNNTVYTIGFDPSVLVTASGRGLLGALAGAVGTELANDYASQLFSSTLFAPGAPPFVQALSSFMPGTPSAVAGRQVDAQALLDLNGYLDSLPAPAAGAHDVAAAARGGQVFAQNCTTCHVADQNHFVKQDVIPIETLFPGYKPTVIAVRPGISSIQDDPNSHYDDRVVLFDASLRGLARGYALPILLDLARKPAFLHDGSVATMDALLDSSRGSAAPHPFYAANASERSDLVEYLKSLTTK
jgi:mono/diheme cytochrome c family protein